MVIGSRYPQLLLKPCEVLGEAMRATGQAPVALALREVIAFDKARVHRLTDWRSRQVRRHSLLCTKHHMRAHLHHAPFGALLDDRRVQQGWEWPTAGVRIGALRALSRRLVPVAVGGQQGILVLGQLITREKRDVMIRHMRDPR